MTDKKALRAEMRERRRTYVATLPDRRPLLAALCDIVLPRLPAEGVVAAYSAYGDEVDPALVVQALAGRVALPWFADRETPMQFRRWNGGQLEGGPFGIAQPAGGAVIDPDVLLVPLVAADARCHRLGQGRGHYDRALDALGKRKAFRAIGLAWDVQLIDEVPADPWDMPLDAIATPTRWITALQR